MTTFRRSTLMRAVMRILAIDPGYARMGVAILEGNPSRPTLLYSDCITPPKGTASMRLAHLEAETGRLIRTYAPTAVAIETLFFGANKTTAMGVAEARGMILAQAGVEKLPVLECSPQQVKLAVTGMGNADKAAVMRMVPHLVTLSTKKRLDDEFDAIALGIAALAIGIRA